MIEITWGEVEGYPAEEIIHAISLGSADKDKNIFLNVDQLTVLRLLKTLEPFYTVESEDTEAEVKV